MAGRPPKPSQLKLVEGNRGKRAITKHEPDPTYLQDITAPTHLSDQARAVWDELAPKLQRAKLLTELDTAMLEMTCIAVANHRLVTELAGTKLLHRNEETGSVSASPYLIVQSMAFKQAVLGLARFGMSPQDRARVVVNPQSELFNHANDPAARYFR